MVLYLFQDVHGLLENVAPAALAAVAERANDETQSGAEWDKKFDSLAALF